MRHHQRRWRRNGSAQSSRKRKRQADAGDLVTGALLALAALPYTTEAGDLLAVRRILYDAHFNRKERLVLHGQIGLIHTAVFSPDETLVATAASDKTVCVWRVRDGALIAKLSGHDDEVWSAFSVPTAR